VAEVYLAVSTGTIAVYDARTGAFLRRVTVPGGPAGAMAVDERRGHLFLTSNLAGSNTLRVLDLRSLALLETIHYIGTDTAEMAIDQPTRHLFLANTGNSVSVVNLGP
jgi:DNA-binding beta-propeller fold protein YncE